MKRLVAIYAILCIAVLASAQAKYVFYFIGDGMGANQVLATEMYLAELRNQIDRRPLCMTQFPYSGQAATFSKSNSITDSSAAGTCLASGVKTRNGYLGVNADGKPVESIASLLHHRNFLVGVTTSVSIDHATPGAFYAHSISRSNYYEIGTHLAESGFEFFGGASFIQPNDKQNPDNPNLYDFCEDHGYIFAHGFEDAQYMMGKQEKMILIQETEGKDKNEAGAYKLPYAIDKSDKDLTLPQIVNIAIKRLYQPEHPFFLMVEGGAIDWACHGNDAATAVREVIEFDEAIRAAYDFYLAHKDETLIVVTADHETGGMALGNSDYTLNLKALKNQTASSDVLTDGLKRLQQEKGKKLTWNDVKQYYTKMLGLYTEVPVSAEEDAALQATYKKMMKNKSKSVKTLYKEIDGMSFEALSLLNKKSKIGWTTRSHSASAVPVFAIGVGAENFSGWHDNSELPMLILKATE